MKAKLRMSNVTVTGTLNVLILYKAMLLAIVVPHTAVYLRRIFTAEAVFIFGIYCISLIVL
jgi:hypothetical protein